MEKQEEETKKYLDNKIRTKVNANKYFDSDFMKRVEFFKNKHDSKIEDLRSKNIEAKLVSYTFYPQVSEKAKSIGKRTVDDLIVK